MSVTVADLLELPSLREARLAAGRGGLNKLVSSISVLEYADPSILQDALFKNNEFYGSEVVITGFMNIPNDVEAQCANIRRLAEAGEVGLILYYVGVFLPRVDRKLLELADELDFALIVMPENRMDQRYSEVICEVMEAIFKDQNTSAALVSDILDRASLLPEHQRTVDTVLKLLSDRTRASAVLTDGAGRVLNAVAWPRTAAVDLEERLRRLESLPEAGGAPLELRAGEARCLLYRCALSDPAPGMELFLFKEGEPLTADLVRQAGEVVRLAANLWSQSHDRVVMSELVRAILKDEPIKMRRLAEIFHVDVGSIHSMWVLRPGLEGREEFRAKGLELVRELLAHHCTTVVADWYEGDLVAFMDWPAGGGEAGALADMCCAQLEQAGLRAVLTLCQSLATTADVRRAYLAIRAFQNCGQDIIITKGAIAQHAAISCGISRILPMRLFPAAFRPVLPRHDRGGGRGRSAEAGGACSHPGAGRGRAGADPPDPAAGRREQRGPDGGAAVPPQEHGKISAPAHRWAAGLPGG